MPLVPLVLLVLLRPLVLLDWLLMLPGGITGGMSGLSGASSLCGTSSMSGLSSTNGISSGLCDNRAFLDNTQISNQMYIITVKQAGLEFQYTQGQFKIPNVSAFYKNFYINCS